MTTPPAVCAGEREPELRGQTVVVIGGSSGIGLETARRARAEGADVIVTGRDPQRLRRAAAELGALRTAAFDATDSAALDQFFHGLPEQIDHVMVTGPGPYYAPPGRPRPRACAPRFRCAPVARRGSGTACHRPGAARRHPAFMGGTGGRRPGISLALISAGSAELHALIANLALEVAPVRVNLLAPGFVDTPLSAALLGEDLDKRRDQLRATLPIGRVVGPADVAALAVHLMTNTAVTGATYDVDGGQQLAPG